MDRLRARLLEGGVQLHLSDEVVDDEIKAKLKVAEGDTKAMWKEVVHWIEETVLVPWPALTTNEKALIAWWVHNRVILPNYKRGVDKNGKSLGRYTSLKLSTVSNALRKGLKWNNESTEKALGKWGNHGDGEKLVVVHGIPDVEKKKVADVIREMRDESSRDDDEDNNYEEDNYEEDKSEESSSEADSRDVSDDSDEASRNEGGSKNESDVAPSMPDAVALPAATTKPATVAMVVPMKGVGGIVSKSPPVDHVAAKYRAMPRLRPRSKSVGVEQTPEERLKEIENEVDSIRMMAEVTGDMVEDAQQQQQQQLQQQLMQEQQQQQIQEQQQQLLLQQQQIKLQQQELKQQQQQEIKLQQQQQLDHQQQRQLMASKGQKPVSFVRGEVIEPTCGISTGAGNGNDNKYVEEMKKAIAELGKRVLQMERREEALNARVKALEVREKDNKDKEAELDRREDELRKREAALSKDVRRSERRPSPRTNSARSRSNSKAKDVDVSWAGRAANAGSRDEVPKKFNERKPNAQVSVSAAARGESRVEVFVPAGAAKRDWEEDLKKEGFQDAVVRRGATGWASIRFKSPEECNRALESKHRWSSGLEVRRGITVAERNRRRMEQEARRVNEGRRRMLGSWDWGGPRGGTRGGPWYYPPSY